MPIVFLENSGLLGALEVRTLADIRSGCAIRSPRPYTTLAMRELIYYGNAERLYFSG